MTEELKIGAKVLTYHTGRNVDGLGVITRVGSYHGAPGAWITTTDTYPTFTPDWCVKFAVVGETVCRTPRFECTCGKHHVSAEALAKLPSVTEEDS